MRFRFGPFSLVCLSFPLVSLSALLLSSLTTRFSLNKSPWSEINGSISIRASSSLEVVGTARSPSSVRRLMAFFFSGKTAVSILRDLVSCQ